jgi:hypothetical protein
MAPDIYRYLDIVYMGIDNWAWGASNQPDFKQSLSRTGYTNTSGYFTWFENTSRNQTAAVKLGVTNFPSGSDGVTTLSAGIDTFWMYDAQNQIYLEAQISFRLPLTGTSATSGWYSNIIPLEAPEDSEGWWLIAQENATQNIHIYRISYPQQLYGWSK